MVSEVSVVECNGVLLSAVECSEVRWSAVRCGGVRWSCGGVQISGLRCTVME
jgi:hypothetical protein